MKNIPDVSVAHCSNS